MGNSWNILLLSLLFLVITDSKKSHHAQILITQQNNKKSYINIVLSEALVVFFCLVFNYISPQTCSKFITNTQISLALIRIFENLRATQTTNSLYLYFSLSKD